MSFIVWIGLGSIACIVLSMMVKGRAHSLVLAAALGIASTSWASPANAADAPDAWITTKVKSQFIGVDDLKDSDINVDTANHVVTLKGRVLTAAGRTKAVDIAKQTDGVTKVIDQLTIGPKR